jgi:hypothetical protein
VQYARERAAGTMMARAREREREREREKERERERERKTEREREREGGHHLAWGIVLACGSRAFRSGILGLSCPEVRLVLGLPGSSVLGCPSGLCVRGPSGSHVFAGFSCCSGPGVALYPLCGRVATPCDCMPPGTGRVAVLCRILGSSGRSSRSLGDAADP